MNWPRVAREDFVKRHRHDLPEGVWRSSDGSKEWKDLVEGAARLGFDHPLNLGQKGIDKLKAALRDEHGGTAK